MLGHEYCSILRYTLNNESKHSHMDTIGNINIYQGQLHIMRLQYIEIIPKINILHERVSRVSIK